jgi:hypothetical protein
MCLAGRNSFFVSFICFLYRSLRYDNSMCQHWPSCSNLAQDTSNRSSQHYDASISKSSFAPATSAVGLNASNPSSHLPRCPVLRARRSVVTDCAQPPKLTPCRRPRFSPAFGRPTTIIAGILPAASVLRGVRSPCTPGPWPPIARSAIHPFLNRRSAEFP